MTIGAIAAPVVGGLLGGSKAKRDAERAAALRAQALGQYDSIDIPTFEEQLLNLQTPDYVGDLIAQQEQAVDVGPTAMDDVSVDPRLQAMQMQALEQIAGRADAGLSEEALNELQQSQRATQGAAQAKQQQILQAMQQRGQGGSGAELAARLMAAQQAADSAGQQGREIAARSAQEDDAAMDALSRVAGGMRSQEFGEQSDVARARDILNQFKAQNTQGVRSRNVSAQNTAAGRNIGERQRMADMASQTRNIEEQRRASLHGDQFNRQMDMAGAKANIMTGQAGAADRSAGRTADMWSGIGSGIGSAIGSFGKKVSSSPTNAFDARLQEDAEINAALGDGYSSPFKVR